MPSQAIKDELQRLATLYGRLEPKQVIEAARDPASPLHSYFEWDDRVAAERYRENQARTLIRSVTVTIVSEGQTFAVPCYVRDPTADHREQGYVELAKIKTGTEHARDVLDQEVARVEATLARARSVAIVLGLSEEIEEMIQRAARIRAKLDEAA